MHWTAYDSANPERADASRCTPAPGQRPAVTPPCPAVADHRPVPSRQVVWMLPPMRRTFVASMSGLGDASGPKTACRSVRSWAPCQPPCAAPQQRHRGRVVRRKDRARAWEGVKARAGRRALGTWCAGVVARFERVPGRPAWGQERLAQERLGGDHPLSGGQWDGTLQAWMRWWMTSVERPWWSRKKRSREERRASGTAGSVGHN
jgi:hypothetical protein